MKCFIDPSAVFIYRPVVDFRKSINGLALIVEQELDLDPCNSALYLFANKTRDKAKILYWDRTGFALWYKRLEKARFKWPRDGSQKTLNIDEQQLHWLLDGYAIEGHTPLYFSSVG